MFSSIMISYYEIAGLFSSQERENDVCLMTFWPLTCRPTQLVIVTVGWTFRRREGPCCATISLSCPMSPPSAAALASPTKACVIFITLIWVCVGPRWEWDLCRCSFVNWCSMCDSPHCIPLTETRGGLLCGQRNRDWKSGEKLHLSVCGGSLWYQESEHGVLPAFCHRGLTHW